jgi:hypothetical protein
MTQAEIDFVMKIVGIIGQAGYTGSYEVVGSRTLEHYISFKQLRKLFFEFRISEDTLKSYHKILNNAAKSNNICAGAVPVELVKYLPANLPYRLTHLFEYPDNIKGLGSDLDLLIGKRPKNILPSYLDSPYPDGTGLWIQIWEGRKKARKV